MLSSAPIAERLCLSDEAFLIDSRLRLEAGRVAEGNLDKC